MSVIIPTIWDGILNVVSEATAHLDDGTNVLLADEDTLRVLVLSIALSQSEGCLHGVANLTAVPFESAHVIAIPDEVAGGR
jgi:hypothetical protein